MAPEDLEPIFAALTSRHLDVLTAVRAAGVAGERRHAALARRLGIAVSTLRTHLRELYALTGCPTVDELAARWEANVDGYLGYVARRIGHERP